MASLNKVMIIGNLTSDPEIRYTPKGTAVCNLTVAVNRKWKDNTGKPCEEVAFVGCTAFGKTAEIIGEHLHKGSPIFVEGRLAQESWEDKDGRKQTKTKVVIQEFQFLSSGRNQNANDYPKDTEAHEVRTGSRRAQLEHDEGNGEEIPF